MTDKLTEELRELSRLYRQLEDAGGPEQDGELFEEVIGKEEDILESIGLKPTQRNLRLLWALSTYKDLEVGISITSLFLTEVLQDDRNENLSPLETLAKGLTINESPFDTLPKMDLETHDYYLFLHELLKQDHSQIVPIYNDMMRAKEYLSEIYLLKKGYEELVKNISHLEEYLMDLPADSVFDAVDFSEEELSDEAGNTAKEKDDYEVFGKILKIEKVPGDNTYTVLLSIVPEEERGSEKISPSSFQYCLNLSFTGEDFEMTPDDKLEKCMDIYGQYELPDNLGPGLKRSWKTALIADNLVSSLIDSNVLGTWSSEMEDE